VQAGFEPWIGGTGLAVTSFAAAVNSGGPTTPGDPPPSSAACRVTYGTNVWNGGFTANVTVANTGTAAVNGWTLGFTLPSGQAITSSWNAALTGTSGAVTARNIAWNGAIPAGGSTSFGFQGTYGGSFARPASFTLNGATCGIA
jgi:cellulase/cellobiase CelA1